MNNFRLKLAAILLDSPLNTAKGPSDNTFDPTASAGAVAADESIVIQTQMSQLTSTARWRDTAAAICDYILSINDTAALE
jgi:hypothetical protein